MKNTIIFLFVLVWSSSPAQKFKVDASMLKMGWSFASPLILKKVNDPLTKEIINKTIPKIIDQDVKGAVFEVSDAIYRIKNIKVLNKEFLTQLEINVNDGIKAIQQKDYATAVNGLVKAVAFTENYLKKGILDVQESATQVPAEPIIAAKTDIVTKKEINGKLFLSNGNDYLFFIPNGNFTQENAKIPVESGTGEASDFHVSLDNGKNFEMGVGRFSSDNMQQASIERVQADKEIAAKIKEFVSGMLSKSLGEGEIIKSEIASFPNFKALKYTYLYTDKSTSNSSMAYILISFHESSMFMIYFNTAANDFLETSKSFDDLMRTFFIVGIDEISDNNSKSYSKASITKITVKKFPPMKTSTLHWDNAMANYQPDIYYIITTQSGQVLRKLDETQRIEDLNPQRLPVSFSLAGNSFMINDLKETIFISLYDYDSFTLHDRVGVVGFKLSDNMFGKNAYPEEITNSYQETEIAISVKWE
jgi:hypothetical protein